jgi:AAA+ ATPase superfamily predicted ATPase
MLETNIFAVMEAKLQEANDRGIKPVIIIDEFQYLKNIIIDKENNLSLVQELFKFFIAMTKVQHLCHIVCLTSDSYYIEELYTDTKLKNTSEYFLMEHLTKPDIQYRL